MSLQVSRLLRRVSSGEAMTKPVNFAREVINNENLETAFPFKWLASQWPLPEGSYFEMDVRANPDAPAVLSFASVNSPRKGVMSIDTLYDATRNVLQLGVLAPKQAIEPLARGQHYLFDIRLTRPRGSEAPRVDVIASGFFLIKKGVTRG